MSLQSRNSVSVQPHLLHVHSTFDLGGKEARAIRLMNAFGGKARHSIVSAMPGNMGAREAIAAGISVEFPHGPPLTGHPSLSRYKTIARFLQGFDLVLTYNWGAMDAVMAHRLHVRDMPPLIHHEDGFNADEAERLKTSRNLFRRVALASCHRLVVPSLTLERVAGSAWKQPESKLVRIPNGINLASYRNEALSAAIPGFAPKNGQVVVGTLAGLREVKNLPLLVRAVAKADADIYLVIVGSGPEEERIRQEIAASGIEGNCLMPGFLPDPAAFMGLFDIFTLSSHSEQYPISVVEAIAAGLPVVATHVGDIADMVAPDNREFLVPPGDEDALAAALGNLARHPDLRSSLGTANVKMAQATNDEAQMIARYAALYGDCIGISLMR